MTDLLITLIICLTFLAVVTIVAVQVGRTSRNSEALRYEHRWKEMQHKETMLQLELMKPAPLPPPAPKTLGDVLARLRP